MENRQARWWCATAALQFVVALLAGKCEAQTIREHGTGNQGELMLCVWLQYMIRAAVPQDGLCAVLLILPAGT
jgi:hypothetical protein